MKTYYIVETVDVHGKVEYTAHSKGLLSTFNKFDDVNYVSGTRANTHDKCVYNLKREVGKKEIRVVGVIRL